MILFLQCVVFCALFTLMILPAQYKNPLVMIASYPPEVRARVAELPQYQGTIKNQEKAHITKKLAGLVFFVFLFAVIAYCSGCRTFVTAFVHVFTLFFVVNLYDLVILDWGIFCHSKRLRIPGTEDMEEAYKNKWFHVKGGIVGTALGLIVALLSGCIVHFVSIL